MKKFTRILAVLMTALMALIMLVIPAGAVSADDYGKLADKVDTNKYWVVYHEKSRDRVELSTFTVTDGFKAIWNGGLSVANGGSYTINHYYYNGSSFVFFEKYDNLLSGGCSKIYASNVDFYDSSSSGKVLFRKTFGAAVKADTSKEGLGKLANGTDNKKYWVVYCEHSRKDRIELSSFDLSGSFKVIWNKKLYCDRGSYTINHYYYDEGKHKFIFFENYNNALSNDCSKIIASNVDVYDKNGKLVFKKTYGANSTTTTTTTTTSDTMQIIYLTEGDRLSVGMLVNGKTNSSATFSSSNSKVVSVSSKGKIKARSAGTAIITTKSGNATVKIQVVVKADD